MNSKSVFQKAFTPFYTSEPKKLSSCIEMFCKLKNIISTYDNVDFYSTDSLNAIILYLIENAPSEADTLVDIQDKVRRNKYLKWDLFYAGQATHMNVGPSVYEKCNFTLGENCRFSAECLIRLKAELTFPNSVSPFEDFAEHIISTYNIIYLCLQHTQKVQYVQKLLIALYLVIYEYLDSVTGKEYNKE